MRRHGDHDITDKDARKRAKNRLWMRNMISTGSISAGRKVEWHHAVDPDFDGPGSEAYDFSRFVKQQVIEKIERMVGPIHGGAKKSGFVR